MVRRAVAALALSLFTTSALAEGAPPPAADAKPGLNNPYRVDPSAPKPEGKAVELAIEGGAPGHAYLAEPKGKPQGALLVIHEWWGLNDHIRHEADQFAKQGYEALAVDLYDGRVATAPEEAMKLKGGLDQKRALAIETAGIAWLEKNAAGQKIATVGWCMGGGQSLAASLADPKAVSATVIYYGAPVTDVAQLKALKGPVLGIWGTKDSSIPPAKVQEFDKALTEAGVAHEFHSYDAEHAFANPTGGRFNPPAAKDADAKRDAFLAKNLRAKK